MNGLERLALKQGFVRVDGAGPFRPVRQVRHLLDPETADPRWQSDPRWQPDAIRDSYEQHQPPAPTLEENIRAAWEKYQATGAESDALAVVKLRLRQAIPESHYALGVHGRPPEPA